MFSSNSGNNQQQPQQQQYGAFGGYGAPGFPGGFHGGVGGTKPIQRVAQPTDGDKTKPLAAVIVTLFEGSSYDALFRVKPQIVDGGRVSVWAVQLSAVTDLLQAVDKPREAKDDFKELSNELPQVEKSSVVFNFECCGHCSVSNFGPDTDGSLALVASLLNHGFMVMVSDFSLKAMIGKWKEALFGPNPFVQCGEFGAGFVLRFDAAALKQCVSAQLKVVGELCSDGLAEVHAMGGTCAYTLKKDMPQTDKYQLSLFTVITKVDGADARERFNLNLCHGKLVEIASHHGILGHAALKYPSGGVLLCSSGHWLELSQLSTSESNVWSAMRSQWGADALSTNMAEYSAMPVAQQRAQLQTFAQNLVQQSAPCSYSNLQMK